MNELFASFQEKFADKPELQSQIDAYKEHNKGLEQQLQAGGVQDTDAYYTLSWMLQNGTQLVKDNFLSQEELDAIE